MALPFLNQKKEVADPNLSEKVLELAHQRAEKIIERALKKSDEIVGEIEYLKAQINREMKQMFRQAADTYMHTLTMESKEFAEAVTALVPQVKEQYIKGVEQTIAMLQAHLSKELIPVRQIVDEKVKETTEELKKRVNEEWQTAHAEIEAYKAQKQKEVDELLSQKIEILAKQAFGKALSASQHQQIVLDALARAKEEGVFNA